MASIVKQMVRSFINDFEQVLQTSDFNRDRTVDRQELIAILVQVNHTPWQMANKMANKILRRLDKNHDARISIEDVMAQFHHIEHHITNIQPTVERMIQSFINNFEQVLQTSDFNRDRTVDRQELIAILVQVNHTPRQIANKIANEILRRLDKNHDARISIEDAIGQFPCIGHHITNIQPAVERMVQSFIHNFEQVLQTSDFNRDRTVDRQELIEILVQVNHTPWQIANEMADEVLWRLDRDRDARISIEDMMAQFPHIGHHIIEIQLAVEQMIQSFIHNFEQVLQISDFNRDRTVDRQELIAILVQANTPWQIANEMANEILQRLDRNHNADVSIDDVLAQVACMGHHISKIELAVEQMVQSFTNDFEQVLQTSDFNRDRTVDRQELIAILVQANTPWQIANEMANEILQRLDRDRDARISIADAIGQFPCIGHHINKIQMVVEQTIQSLIDNFEQVLQTSDFNRDRTIDRQELIAILVQADTPWQVANEMANEILQRLDRDRDARISIEEVMGQVPHVRHHIIQRSPTASQEQISKDSLNEIFGYVKNARLTISENRTESQIGHVHWAKGHNDFIVMGVIRRDVNQTLSALYSASKSRLNYVFAFMKNAFLMATAQRAQPRENHVYWAGKQKRAVVLAEIVRDANAISKLDPAFSVVPNVSSSDGSGNLFFPLGLNLPQRPTYPVLKCCEMTYWAYNYRDNRLATCIVAFNEGGQVVRQWEKPGAKDIWHITIDKTSKTVKFWGNDNHAVVITWAELDLISYKATAEDVLKVADFYNLHVTRNEAFALANKLPTFDLANCILDLNNYREHEARKPRSFLGASVGAFIGGAIGGAIGIFIGGPLAVGPAAAVGAATGANIGAALTYEPSNKPIPTSLLRGKAGIKGKVRFLLDGENYFPTLKNLLIAVQSGTLNNAASVRRDNPTFETLIKDIGTAGHKAYVMMWDSGTVYDFLTRQDLTLQQKITTFGTGVLETLFPSANPTKGDHRLNAQTHLALQKYENVEIYLEPYVLKSSALSYSSFFSYPVLYSNHQKIGIFSINGTKFALVSGFNTITPSYNDEVDHPMMDGGHFTGESWHDTGILLQGEIVDVVEAEFDRRWSKKGSPPNPGSNTYVKFANWMIARESKLDAPNVSSAYVNPSISTPSVDMQVLTTNGETSNSLTQIRDKLMTAISSAQDYVYFENFTFQDVGIIQALAQKLQTAPPSFKAIVMLPFPTEAESKGEVTMESGQYYLSRLGYLILKLCSNDWVAFHWRMNRETLLTVHRNKVKDFKVEFDSQHQNLENTRIAITFWGNESQSIPISKITFFHKDPTPLTPKTPQVLYCSPARYFKGVPAGDAGKLSHYRPNFRRVYIHSKLALIDDKIAFIGSANFSKRSMQYDGELSVMVDDRDTVTGIRQQLFTHWEMDTVDNWVQKMRQFTKTNQESLGVLPLNYDSFPTQVKTREWAFLTSVFSPSDIL